MDNKKRKESQSQDSTPAPQDAKRRPIHTIRAEDCSASIWARETVVQGQPKIFYSVTLERSYKDRDGSWKYTKTFDANSLGAVVTLCQQASAYIEQQQEAA